MMDVMMQSEQKGWVDNDPCFRTELMGGGEGGGSPGPSTQKRKGRDGRDETRTMVVVRLFLAEDI